MKPEILGISTYFSFWGVAAVFGIWAGLRLARQAGFAARPAFVALCVIALAIVIGSKAYYLVEYVLFPMDDPLPLGQDNVLGALRHGFRIPGGLLLLALTLPALCRVLGLPTWRFADAVIPAAGVAVFFIRIGCFFNGCCFGTLTNGPFGVTFPAGSRAYEWQLLQGIVAWPADHALPMYPLQLYFASFGILLYVFGRRWQATKRFDGEVFANCYALFFGSTFLLEFVRPAVLHLNLLVTLAVTVVAVVVSWRARQALPTAVRATP
jgi:phosphatidylglycerol:prolipoprotein diacylglycerol transferase